MGWKREMGAINKKGQGKKTNSKDDEEWNRGIGKLESTKGY